MPIRVITKARHFKRNGREPSPLRPFPRWTGPHSLPHGVRSAKPSGSASAFPQNSSRIYTCDSTRVLTTRVLALSRRPSGSRTCSRTYGLTTDPRPSVTSTSAWRRWIASTDTIRVECFVSYASDSSRTLPVADAESSLAFPSSFEQLKKNRQ